MNIHYGAVRREEGMSKSSRYLFLDNEGFIRSYYLKPSRATLEHECAGMADVDVLKVISTADERKCRS